MGDFDDGRFDSDREGLTRHVQADKAECALFQDMAGPWFIPALWLNFGPFRERVRESYPRNAARTNDPLTSDCPAWEQLP